MARTTTIEKLRDVKARQAVWARWMDVSAAGMDDDQEVVVTTEVTPFGRFLVAFRLAAPEGCRCPECGESRREELAYQNDEDEQVQCLACGFVFAPADGDNAWPGRFGGLREQLPVETVVRVTPPASASMDETGCLDWLRRFIDPERGWREHAIQIRPDDVVGWLRDQVQQNWDRLQAKARAEFAEGRGVIVPRRPRRRGRRVSVVAGVAGA